MATSHQSMRLRTGLPKRTTNNGKSTVTTAQVTRTALHEIGNKVSNMTIDPKGKDMVQKATRINVAIAAAQKTAASTCTNSNLPVQVKQGNALKATDLENKSTKVVHSPMEISPVEDICTPRINMGNVFDIDAEDADNPQLASEYVNEIYAYLRDLEKTYSVRPNYLNGQEITGKMRAILIDWLCQVHHRFRLLQETLFLTVSIIDRFLQVNPVGRSKLQLVGVTAMLIASKYEEMYAPEVSDFVYITDNAYTRMDIRQMEIIILKALDFRIGKPLCLHFLRRNSKAGQVDGTTHTLAKYLMELTINEYDMVHYHPSLIAAAALCLSIHLLYNGDWNDTLSYYSTYTLTDLTETMKKLAKLVIKSETSKLTAVRIKYQSSKFNKISSIPELKGEQIRALISS